MLEQKTIAHYRIEGQIGAGAMGVVCKAHDLRLNRIVALKYLAPETTSDPASKQRLLQEARAASQLDHPNVCRIHQIEELEDGQIVLVLSYYEGETLAARIARGRLELSAAVHFASQLLSGLGHAHSNGVIHRDIKPSNLIVLRNDELKIIDFGLAKGSNTGPQLTETGAFLGTISYMSPEQILCKEVDCRADIWASGVVLYEMLTGHLPFTGESPYAVFEAILQAKPRELQHHVPELPASIGSALARALARDLSVRYRSATEFLAALDMLASPSRATAPTHLFQSADANTMGLRANSVLVLPFTGPDNQTDAEYFCDGLTDEIITDLSSVRSLRTICSTSAMRLKGTQDTPQKLAQDLHVRYVLQGSVRLGNKPQSAGNTIRVTVQLIDPVDDLILWAEKYNGTLEDVFAIQEQISRQVVRALRLTLTPAEDKHLLLRPLPDVRAYQYYLKAKHEILSYSREALERALDNLDQGERLVGNNALLLSAKGQVYWQYVNAGISSDLQYLSKAKDCASRALELDPDSADACRLLGLISLQEGETQKAIRLLKQSMASAPNDSDSLSWYCAICALSGKAHAAMPLGRRIAEIDPLTPIYRFIPGLLSLMAGEFDDALPSFEEAIRHDPGNTMLLWCRGQVLALARRNSEAIGQFQAMQLTCPDQFFTNLGAFMAAALSGDTPAAIGLATSGLKDLVAGDPHYSWAMAQGYAAMGETAESLHWLENAMRKGFLNYPMIARWDPMLEPLRREARFSILIREMKSLWEAFEV